jgi:hypothetical protein
MARTLCIVTSPELVRDDEAAELIRRELGTGRSVEVVLDRRQARDPVGPGRRAGRERRRQPEADALLRARGFVLVEPDAARPPRPSIAELLGPVEPERDEPDALEEDEEGRRRGRRLATAGVTVAILALAVGLLAPEALRWASGPGWPGWLVPSPMGEWLRIGPPRPEPLEAEPAAPPRTLATRPPDGELAPEPGAEAPPRPGETSAAPEAHGGPGPIAEPPGRARPEPPAVAPTRERAREAGPPRAPREGPARRTRSAESSPEPRDLSAARSLARFPGLPRVEVRTGRGDAGGTTYVVALRDEQGRPLGDAEVWIAGRAPKGGDFRQPLRPGPEPGTYAAIVPAPAESGGLRLHVALGGQRLETPLTP